MSVCVVSNNPETLDGLERYLRDAGVSVRGTRLPEQAWEMLAPERTVVVVFPDDFSHTKVLSALGHLRRKRPDALVLLVTKDAKGFASAHGAVVIPKPVWGWTILDAIRARLGPPE